MTDAVAMPLGPLMIDIEGPALSEEDRDLLLHPQVGGVILFTRNYRDPDQLRALTETIRSLRTPRLLIAVDHEGGRVQRFRDGFTALPPMAEYGAQAEQSPGAALAAVREHAFTIARELVDYGIDLPFAPVLDCDLGLSAVIGDRALAADPDTVIALASAFCDGLAEGGMASTGKHFPGHGGVQVDSHEALPSDHRDLAQLRAACLSPFAGMVKRGLDSVMTAHIHYPAVDAQPATFSRYWLQDILRGELGFEGIIISDDLVMGGAAAFGGTAERVAAAQAAGCELILLCNDRAAVRAAVHAGLAPPSEAASARLCRLHAAPPGAAAVVPDAFLVEDDHG
ncbi:beta-N-acetylhexosaminidase [Algiphilus sp.]|uniref:beta-N-acetylhexosaminidase n=1 Tax=Algiphilus sp. TaxID=1872431 RepID=UPI003B51EB81